MIRPFTALVLTAFGSMTLWGAPTINPAGVMNAASLLPPGVPGGALSPGSLFVVRGRQLGPAPSVHSDSPSADLAGVSISITVGGNTWKALLVEAGDSELRAVVPNGVGFGAAAVVVSARGLTSSAVYTRVLPASPGIFTFSNTGWGPALKTPVRRGSRIALQATRLGVQDPQKSALEVFVGGRKAQRVTAARADSCCGIDLLTFDVPNDAPSGCQVPIQVRALGSIPSNAATLLIEPLPPSCRDLEALRWNASQAGRHGIALAFRLSMVYEVEPGKSAEFTGDALVGAFREGTMGGLTERLLYPPVPGTCTVFSNAATLKEADREVRLGFLSQTRQLDGGEFSASVGGTPKSVARMPLRDEYEYGVLGGSMLDRLDRALPLFFRPGPIVITTRGGPDVPPLSVRVPFPQPITWTNRSDAKVVDRGRDLEFRWQSSDAGQPVAVAGMSMDKPGQASAAFLCLAEPGARNFHVPSFVLQGLPSSRTRWDDSLGYLMIGTLPAHAELLFSASGLDQMVAAGVSLDGRTARFR